MGQAIKLSSPQSLAAHHNLADFDCGVTSLNEWLQRRALPNQVSGASRSFIVCEDDKIVGYYALASGAVSVKMASGRFRRNMPEPVPVAILARLAVSVSHHGKGLGRALFQDAGHRLIEAADIIGIRGMIVHAISETAKEFYMSLGLESSPLDPMMLMVTLADLKAALASTIA